MPKPKSATKKPKEPKFMPVQRICAYAPCSKPFTAKREKEYFHAAKCRQAQFGLDRSRKQASAALQEYHKQLAKALGAPSDVTWFGSGLLKMAEARTSQVFSLTNALAMSVPQTVLQEWLFGMSGLNGIINSETFIEFNRKLPVDISKVITGLYQQMLQFSQNHAPGHCPQCGGTVNDPEFIWRNERRCASEWHRTERLILDARAGS